MSAIQQYLEDFKKILPSHLQSEAVAEVRCHLEELVVEGQRRGLSLADCPLGSAQSHPIRVDSVSVSTINRRIHPHCCGLQYWGFLKKLYLDNLSKKLRL